MPERSTKPVVIKARVSEEMKRQIDEIAAERGEAEAIIIREAVTQYLARKQAEAEESESR